MQKLTFVNLNAEECYLFLKFYIKNFHNYLPTNKFEDLKFSLLVIDHLITHSLLIDYSKY